MTTVVHRAVFPSELEWASFVNESICESACGSGTLATASFPTPASLRALLATHKLVVVGTPTRIDGILVEQVMASSVAPPSSSFAPVVWIRPKGDEIVRLTESGRETDYHWHRPTAGSLSHLDLSIPRGFTRIADTYAEAGSIGAVPPANVSYQTELNACADRSVVGLNIGPTTVFNKLRAGTYKRMPWALWYGGVVDGQPVYALLGGTGPTAQCMSNSGGLMRSAGAVEVSQLPGRAVAFAVGLVDPASITSVRVAVESSLRSRPVGLYPLAGTSFEYAFAILRGLSCKELTTGGLASSVLYYNGTKLESSSSGGGLKSSPVCTA